MVKDLFENWSEWRAGHCATVRRGDRVVVKTKEGEVLAKELKRKTARTLELKSLNAEHPDRTFDLDQIAWMARVMWAAQ